MNRSVIDIWSMQPQPHLQPRAALPRSSSGSQKDVANSKNDPPMTITAVSASSSHTASDNSTGTVPRHWGEVVINPRREKARKSGNADAKERRDVFGVLEVSWRWFPIWLVNNGFTARMIDCVAFPVEFCVFVLSFPWTSGLLGFVRSPVDGSLFHFPHPLSVSLSLYTCAVGCSHCHNTPFPCVINFSTMLFSRPECMCFVMQVPKSLKMPFVFWLLSHGFLE